MKEQLYKKMWIGTQEDFYNSVEAEKESNWKYMPYYDHKWEKHWNPEVGTYYVSGSSNREATPVGNKRFSMSWKEWREAIRNLRDQIINLDVDCSTDVHSIRIKNLKDLVETLNARIKYKDDGTLRNDDKQDKRCGNCEQLTNLLLEAKELLKTLMETNKILVENLQNNPWDSRKIS